ncbi:MAG: hypothetical protein ACKPCM_13115 [Pseudanabaena sp.]
MFEQTKLRSPKAFPKSQANICAPNSSPPSKLALSQSSKSSSPPKSTPSSPISKQER